MTWIRILELICGEDVLMRNGIPSWRKLGLEKDSARYTGK
jgi:hypothetical protein